MTKRLLSVFALLTITAGALATDYNIKIGGKMITSENYSNITADNGFTAIKSGTVTYLNYKNILTIKDAVITSTGDDVVLEISDQSNHSTKGPLTLVFEGENTLTSPIDVIVVNSNITINGSGSATLKSTGPGNCPIFITQNHSLTISSARLNCQGAWGIAGYQGNEQLTIDGAYIRVTGSTYGSLRDIKEPTLNGVYIASPTGAVWNTSKNALCDAAGNIIKTEVVIKPEGVDIDATSFPDDIFRDWVSTNCDTNNDGILSPSEIAAKKTIGVSNQGIADLKGVEYFTAATFLNCQLNQLKTLDVSNLTALKTLNASGNCLSTIDVSHNTALTTLTLDDNWLGSLDVSHNTALTSIKVYKNYIRGENMDAFIESLPTASAANCTLYLVSNDGSDWNTYTNDNIIAAVKKGWKVVDSGAQTFIVTIDKNNFPDEAFRTYISENLDNDHDGILSDAEAAITTLNVANLGIANLTGLKFFPQLTTLDCQNNQLTTLYLHDNTKLQTIYCNDNQLTQLSHVMFLYQLTTLHCYNNQINSNDLSDLISKLRQAPATGTLVCYSTADGEGNAQPTEEMASRAAEKNWRLCTVDAGGNLQQLATASGVSITILNFPDPKFLIYVRTFDKNNDNFLSDDELQKATDINVAGMGITSLQGIEYFTEVTKIRCGSNKLTWLDLSKLHYLKTLWAQDNQLQSLIVSKYSDLNEITCDINQLDWYAIKDLVESLPVADPEGTLRIYNTKSPNEHNTYRISSHIAAANEKGWKVMSFDYTDLTEMVPLTGEVVINEMNFPDEVFREYVSWNLDWDGDGILSVDEREWTTGIYVDDSEIADLKGIEFFPNLQSLWCQDNGLTELDLSKNPELLWLYLYSNDLTSLNISACTKLKELYCAFNDLEAIDVTNCTALEELDVWWNALKTIDVTKNTELRYLNLSNNELTSVDVTNNTKLATFKCSENQLTTLDVSRNRALKTLACSGNQLETLDVSACPSLNVLGISTNYITGIGMDALVSSLPTASKATFYVEEDGLLGYDYDNHITAEQAFAAKAKGWRVVWISMSSHLNYATFAGHLPVDINATYFPDEKLRNYIKATFDKDNDGQLSQGEAWTWGVNDNTIDVRGLGITDLTGLGYFIYLEKLYCQENQLETIDTSYHPYLETLHCYANNLQGDAMDFLISGLYKPNRPSVENGTLVAYTTAGTEGNSRPTDDQISTVNAKHWKTYTYNGASFTELTTNFVAINETTFPDETFRTYVSDSCDINSDGRLSNDEIQKVTTMRVGQMGITDMTGVEHFTALQYLFCQNNDLTSLDVTHNTELIRLACGQNQIRELDLTKNTKLGNLHCSNNLLKELDVSRNTKLWRLCCWNNQLTELIVLKNTALDTLSCFGNQLTELNVSKCTELTSLSCYSNLLTTLDVSKCTKLDYISCEYNQLTALDLSKNTQLQYLYCNNNQLSALDLSKNTQLQYLYCNNNQLSALDVTKNAKLIHLNCHYNQLSTLDVTKNTALKYLNCYNNQLTALDVTKNTELKGLSCVNNPLTALNVSQNKKLEDLRCWSNQLTALDVSKCTVLSYLDCDYNQLTALDVSKNTALTSLYCRNNLLTALDVTNNTSLLTLACSGNQLKTLDVSKNALLEYFYCTNNQLKTLDVSRNTILFYLYCNNNQLTTLDVSNCPLIREIRCYNNNIRGAGMDTLVNGLPNNTSWDWYILGMYDTTSGIEHNFLTWPQFYTAYNKGWAPAELHEDGEWNWHNGENLPGDVNADGQVGIGDIVAITNIMAGTETDEDIKARADVNNDSQVGIGDIVAITNIMAGISE